MKKKFLICHLGALGDFIFTWPVLRSLRKFYADCHFIGLGKPAYMNLAIKFGLLDSYLDVEAPRMFEFFMGHDFPAGFKPPAGAILWMVDCEKSVELIQKNASLPVVAIPPFPEMKEHVTSYYFFVLRDYFPLEIFDPYSFEIKLNTQKEQFALVHPGSGSARKNFRPEFYQQIVEKLKNQGFSKVGILLGPIELEQGLQQFFRNEWIVSPATVCELAELLSTAALFVGNDSGVSHLAGVVGTRTVAFYKSTDPKIWGATGPRVVNLVTENEMIALQKIEEIFENPDFFRATDT
jgi:ADP-heptose:LPS heptosyltransferase